MAISGVPIYALTPEMATYTKLALFRDTKPMLLEQRNKSGDQVLADAEALLLEQGVVAKGDLIVITIGEPIGKTGGTNTLKIVRVGDLKL